MSRQPKLCMPVPSAMKGDQLDWGVSPTTLGRLNSASVPGALFLVLGYLREVVGPFRRDTDALEIFSGQGEMSRQLAGAGLRASTYDVVQDCALEDLASPVGFIYAVLQVHSPSVFWFLFPVWAA